MKGKNKGFTLMEMLIVVAIIAILVSISIPTFTNILEKSREAADMANVRSAYAEVLAQVYLDGAAEPQKTVPLKQKVEDWQSADTIDIAGITHTKGQPDTDNWKGTPGPGGSCLVYYSEDVGMVLNWNGGWNGGPDTMAGYPESIWDPLKGLLSKPEGQGGLKGAQRYEVDKNSPTGVRTQAIKDLLKDTLTRTLLNQPNCSWGYYGNAKETPPINNLFWTSIDISKVEKNTNVPTIVAASDGSYYVTTVPVQVKKEGTASQYNVLSTKEGYSQQIDTIKQSGSTPYNSLTEAYKAYEKALAQYEKAQKNSK